MRSTGKSRKSYRFNPTASLHHSRFPGATDKAVLNIVQVRQKRLEETSYATVPIIPGLLSGSLFNSTTTLLCERVPSKYTDFPSQINLKFGLLVFLLGVGGRIHSLDKCEMEPKSLQLHLPGIETIIPSLPALILIVTATLHILQYIKPGVHTGKELISDLKRFL
jgi:hypothetical protein